jgi:predicted phage terminase large subunit-like protein
MTYSDKHIKEIAMIRAKCESDFYFFTRYFFNVREGNKWQRNWHHQLLVDKLIDVYNFKTTRLIINIPPRYGKTDLVVISFIAWCMMKNPRSKFLHVSYSQGLATDNSYKVKQLLQRQEFLELWPNITVAKDASSKSHWYLDNGGKLLAVSSETGMTGFGAGSPFDGMKGEVFSGGIIIDDPVKIQNTNGTPEQVSNYLDGINKNFNTTIINRKESQKTPIILIMQRVHQDDLSGFLLAGKSGDVYEHICLPLINDDGSPLWPFKHSLENLEKEKKLSSFNGQMMQNPRPDEKDQLIKLKYFPRYKILPKREEFEKVFISLDTASSEKEQMKNDPSVAIVAGKFNGKWYIIDVQRFHLDFDDLKDRLADLMNTYKPNGLIIENKASGIQLIQSLNKRNIGNVLAANPVQSKYARMYEEIDAVKAGKIILPEYSDWLNTFEDECAHFPKVTHDDQVDALSQLLKHIREQEDQWFVAF